LPSGRRAMKASPVTTKPSYAPVQRAASKSAPALISGISDRRVSPTERGSVGIVLHLIAVACALSCAATSVLLALRWVLQAWGLRRMALAALAGHQLTYGAVVIASHLVFHKYSMGYHANRGLVAFQCAAMAASALAAVAAMLVLSGHAEAWPSHGVDLQCCFATCFMASWLNNFVWGMFGDGGDEDSLDSRSQCLKHVKKATKEMVLLIATMAVLFLVGMLREAMAGYSFAVRYMIILALTGFKLAVNFFETMLEMEIIKEEVARASDHGLPPDVQVTICERFDHASFGLDFVLLLALKIATTAVPEWWSVLLFSCMQVVTEWAATWASMGMAWCSLQRDVRGGDAEKITTSKARLTLKVVKYLSDTLLEYVCITVVVVGGVIFADCGAVDGFGSFGARDALLILGAQLLPEVFVDSVCILLIRQRIAVSTVHEHVHNDLAFVGVKCLTMVSKMMYVSLAAIRRA